MIRAFVKDALRRLGWSVQQIRYANTEEEVLRSVLRATKPVAILDVGANEGQFAGVARTAGFRQTIISFEALAQPHAHLEKAAAKDPDWIIAPRAAIGSARGEIAMNVAGNLVSSSLLQMHSAHTDVAPDSAYVRSEKVRLERLDALALPLLPSIGQVMLKIDTQGYELEVLKGATAILDRVCAMQVELSLIPLYVGAPGIAQMVSYLDELGFEPFNLVAGYKDLRTGRVIQFDGFFLRKSAR